MARRGGGDKLFNRRKEGKKKSDFNRNKASIAKLKNIIVACEGTKTEPYYLQAYFSYLVKTHRLSAKSFVIAEHKNTHPTGVLDDLLAHKKEGRTYKNYDFKWIVIDRDEARIYGGGHTLENYNLAIAKAKSLNIKVAYSNPSFEIWYLLHFKYQNTAIDRDSVVGELEHIIDYEKNNKCMYELLEANQPDAIRNAKKLIDDCDKNIGLCNPSTNMFELVECLNGFKRGD